MSTPVQDALLTLNSTNEERFYSSNKQKYRNNLLVNSASPASKVKPIDLCLEGSIEFPQKSSAKTPDMEKRTCCRVSSDIWEGRKTLPAMELEHKKKVLNRLVNKDHSTRKKIEAAPPQVASSQDMAEWLEMNTSPPLNHVKHSK